MPLTGELEQLPIVDVIQLIHSTRKSGILKVYSRRGEGQLIFNSGYIVSAIHSNDDLKIGQILLEKEIISESELNQALATQQASHSDAAPLISILHEQCEISKEDAYNALETLIELTLVEMISWARGVFVLETEDVLPADDYKFLPQNFQSINLDTQMVLMDALRIFDEKIHAGELEIIDEPYEGEIPGLSVENSGFTDEFSEGNELSEDILGLADLDQIERRKPQTFEVLDTFDPLDIHRQSIAQALPSIDEEEQQKLLSFLSDFNHFNQKYGPLTMTSQGVILYSSDSFLQHAVMTVCKREGLMTFTPKDATELEMQIEKAANKGFDPIIIFGFPDSDSEHFSAQSIESLRIAMKKKHPSVAQLQLALPDDYNFILSAYDSGCRAVLPYPSSSPLSTVQADDLVKLLGSLVTYIQSLFSDISHSDYSLLKNYLERLATAKKAPEISLLLLKFISEFFDRSLTLVVDRETLIMERSSGIKTDKTKGVSAPIKQRLNINLATFDNHLASAENYYFDNNPPAQLCDALYAHIDAPSSADLLCLPLIVFDRVVTLTYADFGLNQKRYVPLDLIGIFVRQVGVAMENALSKKQR